MNTIIYFLSVVFYTMGRCLVKSSNVRMIQRISFILGALMLVFTIYGVIIYHQADLQAFLYDYENLKHWEHEELTTLVRGMVWIRLIPIVVFLICFSLLCVTNCILFGLRQIGFNINPNNEFFNTFQRTKHRFTAWKGLNNFLRKSSRKYDVAKDAEVKECSICLGDFADQKDCVVTQLSCSERHIFHVECVR